MNPKITVNTQNYVKEELITHKDTPCFAENRHTIKNGGSFVMDYAPSAYICLSGEAVIKGENYEHKIKRGDYFYLPYVAENKFRVESDTEAILIECLPSEQK